MRLRVLQESELPDGSPHVADVGPGSDGALREAVERTAEHYLAHSARGGSVGVAPVAGGFVVQLHGPDGSIESWRRLVVVLQV